MSYLKLILGFFLFAFILIAFLFSPTTVKTAEAHSIYCGAPPEPNYVLDNRFQTHTGPIPYHPVTVTASVSGQQVTFSWSATTGCYAWWNGLLSENFWRYTADTTSVTFTGTCGTTYQPTVRTVMNVDVTFAGYCCNIGHPSDWNHSVSTADINLNNSNGTVGNPVTVTCGPGFTLTAAPGACTGATPPVNIATSNVPPSTVWQQFSRATDPSFTTGLAGLTIICNSGPVALTDNPPVGTYYYRVEAFSGLACSSSSGIIGTATTGPVTVAACFDYNLTNSGNITATQGASGSNTITANLTVGTTQPVSFSASLLPGGTTAGFSPTSCNPTCTSVFSITTSTSTPLGTYPITVTGSPLGKTTSFNLTVTGPPGAFSISPNPPTASCISGNTPAITVSWTASSGATSYNVFRFNSLEGFPPGSALTVAVGLTTTTYVDPTGLNNSQPGPTALRSYQYIVTAVNSLGTLDSPASTPVTALNCANPIVDLKANGSDTPPPIPSGTSATLTWTSASATTCDATESWATTGSKALDNAVGESTGTLVLPGPYTSTLTCTNDNNSASAADSVIINIIAPPPWIQTTGGDVHSNTGINTPGGP